MLLQIVVVGLHIVEAFGMFPIQRVYLVEDKRLMGCIGMRLQVGFIL